MHVNSSPNERSPAITNNAAPIAAGPRKAFQHVGILHHPKKPESIVLAKAIDAYLRTLGIQQIWHASAWELEEMLRHLSEVDLLITLGGDGTLLRAARLGAPYAVPMLGVKMGRLGFLAELMPDDWQTPLARIMSGDYWLEERKMLRACVERVTESETEPGLQRPRIQRQCLSEHEALNDVVLSRGDVARVVRISVTLDGGYLTTYTCDGLIVSTATGSTGYALAVGGPVMPPELPNILVIPVAPHLSMDRAVILSEGSEVRLRASSDYRSMLTVDGQVVVEIGESDEVVVVCSPHVARFVRIRERSYFYQTLMDKMRWAG
ncbi:MAG: NAD(+)/NADH kinase [Caldilineaceae bacterium]